MEALALSFRYRRLSNAGKRVITERKRIVQLERSVTLFQPRPEF